MSGWVWLRIGAISGALAVIAGAFGAHGLRGRIDDHAMEIFGTAVQYQMYHALALVAVGVLGISTKALSSAGRIAGWAYLIGTMVFSGSLYGLALSGMSWLGAITPLGGVALIAGWIALAVAATGAARP